MTHKKHKSEIPKYINCKSKYITHCDFYMHNDCPSTCAYATDINALGVGGMTEWDFDPDTGCAIKKDITKKLYDKLYLEDMRDY